LVSTGQRITEDSGSTPEDRVPTVFDVIEQSLDVRARFQVLVAMEYEVPVPPVQGPQLGAFGVVQTGDGKWGPLRAEVLPPGRPVC
jgi:hypothetical protein